MLLNASALNAVALNAPNRQAVFAFAILAASSVVGAEALVTQFAQAEVFGGVSVVSVPAQVHAASGLMDANCALVAINPRQTFASSSITLTDGGLLAAADITRYCEASAGGTGSASAESWALRRASADAQGNALVSCTAVALIQGDAGASCSGTIFAVSTRTTFGGGTAATSAQVSAAGTIAQKASAVVPVTATVTAAAGFAKPSATLVLSGAQVYAYARVTRRAVSSPMIGSASMSASAKLDAWGVANLSGSALLSAWSVQEQGTAQVAASCDASAEATYVFMARATVSCPASVIGDATRIVPSTAYLFAKGELRPEATLNNLHDGYALPDALANVHVSASGVVVSPAVSYMDSECEVSVRPTYRYQSYSVASVAADVVALGTKTQFAEATLLCSSSPVSARAHFQWYGQAEGAARAAVEAVPSQRHNAFPVGFHATAELVVAGTAVRMSRGTVGVSGSIQAMGVANRMASCVALSSATVSATARVRHAALGSVVASGDLIATGVRERMGYAFVPCAAHAGASASQLHASQAMAAGMSDVLASAVRVLTPVAQVSVSGDVNAASSMRWRGASVVDAGSGVELIAYLLGNAVARDPEERTMRRVGVDRVMRRPFVDRTMKAVRA